MSTRGTRLSCLGVKYKSHEPDASQVTDFQGSVSYFHSIPAHFGNMSKKAVSFRAVYLLHEQHTFKMLLYVMEEFCSLQYLLCFFFL